MTTLAGLLEVLVPMSFFASVVLVIYFISRFNYQIKKSILDKGRDIELTKSRFPFLEIGLTIVGVGLGLAISSIAQLSHLPEDAKELLIGACVLLFGGSGLVSGFLIRKRFEKK